MCSDLSEVAGNIRSISEHCMTSNKERPSGDWLSRQWFHRSLNMYQFPMRCFCLQVLMCSDLSKVAGNIHGICEHCMTFNRERPSGDWLSRQWFTEEVSQVAYKLFMTELFF